MRTTIPMNWADLKRSRFRHRCIGLAFGIAALGVCFIGVLRFFYDLGSDRLFSQFFFQLGLPQLAHAIISKLWHLPGIQSLWELDFRYGYMLALGLFCIGGLFWQLAKKKSQTMRNVNQQANEERLKQERLGFPQNAYSRDVKINVHGGTIHGNVIGDISGANPQVNYTLSDLSAIRASVRKMHTHRKELSLTPHQLIQLEAQLKSIQEQLAALTPNHSRLHELLHSTRHIAEAGGAHLLVGHWREIWHTLQTLGS
jgi:hypothetical protein